MSYAIAKALGGLHTTTERHVGVYCSQPIENNPLRFDSICLLFAAEPTQYGQMLLIVERNPI
jgi:hypothetical protein